MGSLIWATVCLQVEPGHSQKPSPTLGEIDLCNYRKKKYLAHGPDRSTGNALNDTVFFSGVPSGKFLDVIDPDLSDCVTDSEDKRRRRKSGSHFSEARKRGRNMLYQLTSQFSRGGKREVNLGRVSTTLAYFLMWL